MDKSADSYNTIAEPSTGDYREKGSKFLAYAFNVSTIDDIEFYLEEVKSQHPKARHHCYAYRLGIDGEPHRANDDGEPSGTAGRPILGQMLSCEVSDVLIVVVRYFGGTKLGASGLINAYKTSARMALDDSVKKEVVIGSDFKLTFPYSEMGHVMNVVKSLDINIKDKSFEANPELVISIRASEIVETIVQLKANLMHISTEQITEETEVPFCKIEEL